MHRGWIFAGPQGVGKAGIATDFAMRLLVSGRRQARARAIALAPDDNDPAIGLMEAGAHPDFMRLERLEKDDKKGEAWIAGAQYHGVDQVRGLARLLNNAPSMGSRRVDPDRQRGRSGDRCGECATQKP